MADLIIRGMRTPESCFDCVMNYSFFVNLRCNELEGMSGFVGSLPHKNDRHPDCPIGQLPEGHGRLGDLDALQEEFKKFHDGKRSMLIDTATTIVPAEGGGEDG